MSQDNIAKLLIAVFVSAGCLLVIHNMIFPSPTTQNFEGMIYSVINKDKYNVYILTSDSNADNAVKLVKHCVSDCGVPPCNVSVYDDRKAYQLDIDSINGQLSNEDLAFLSEHLLAYKGFDNDVILKYPYK